MKYKFILFSPWLLKSPVYDPKGSPLVPLRYWTSRVDFGVSGLCRM